MSDGFFKTGSKILLVVLISGAFAACTTDYLDRQETISYSAGNATAHNLAVHMIDPWPAHAKNTRIDTSGERVARAVRRYENCYAKEAEVSVGGASSIETTIDCPADVELGATGGKQQ